MWIVRLALRRPFTVAMLCLTIFLFGFLSISQMVLDIMPNIDIPVVSVVWTDNGLFPNDMFGREPASLAPEPGRAADQVLRRRLSALKPPRTVPAMFSVIVRTSGKATR